MGARWDCFRRADNAGGRQSIPSAIKLIDDDVMIGFYNYTVVLTYLSLLSAVSGIVASLSGEGHPYYGAFFLLISGLCDAFDGKVARMKKNRSEREKSFGVQIDSLSDLLAFGALPGCIGLSLARVSEKFPHVSLIGVSTKFDFWFSFGLMVVMFFYVLAAMIRLAYFNVLVEERKLNGDTSKPYFVGLPVTTAALIFPALLLIPYLKPIDITLTYQAGMIIVGFLFIANFRLRKPGNKAFIFMIIVGAIEFILGIIIYRWHDLGNR